MPSDLDIPPASAAYRVPRHRGVDPGTKRLAIIASCLGAALLAVVGVWTLRGGSHGGHVPVIEADGRPIRVKPENPGGMQIAGSNDEIMSGDSSPQSGKLAPPPEAPEIQALRVPQPAPAPKVADAAPTSPPATPAPAAQPPVAAVVPPAPDRKPSPPVAADHPATPATGSRTEVQLAALTSEADAKTEWDRLAKKMPDLLGGRHPLVSRTERDGRTYWRLRTTGFTDVAQATAFCERVRAKGGGCSIASF